MFEANAFKFIDFLEISITHLTTGIPFKTETIDSNVKLLIN